MIGVRRAGTNGPTGITRCGNTSARTSEETTNDSASNAYSADRRRMRDQRYSLRGRLIAEKNPPRQALIFRLCDLYSTLLQDRLYISYVALAFSVVAATGLRSLSPPA